MKKYFVSLTSAFLVTTFAVSGAVAQNRAFVSCPRFIADPATGTYQAFTTVEPGRRCSNSAKALQRLGYIPASTGVARLPQNPELDTERVLTGRGSVIAKTVFRVSTVARVLTITLTNCTSPGAAGNTTFRIVDQKGNSVGDLSFSLSANSPAGLSVFTPGIYGFELDYVLGGSCDFKVEIK